MNLIQRFLFVPISMVVLTGCHSYQYVLLSSELSKDASTKQLYFDEHNDVVVYFDFFGENMPIDLTIQNDADEPLYIDLNRTAFLQNKQLIHAGLVSSPQLRHDLASDIDLIRAETLPAGPFTEVQPGSYIVIQVAPFEAFYKKGLNFKYEPNRAEFYAPSLRHLLMHDLNASGREFEIVMYFARQPDFSDGWRRSAMFKEEAIFKTGTMPQHFPEQKGTMYYTHHHRAGLATLLSLTAVFGGLALLVAIAPDAEP